MTGVGPHNQQSPSPVSPLKMPASSAPPHTATAHRRPHPLPLPQPPDGDPNVRLTTPKLPSTRRSFSSSSSFSFSGTSDTNSPVSPSTPLRPSSTAAAVPFSWEKIPGLPKTPIHMISTTSSSLRKSISQLPLPPIPSREKHGYRTAAREKPVANEGLLLDPFLAALIECSKDEARVVCKGSQRSTELRGSRRSSSADRFGLLVGYSCKRTCAVAESLVFLPRRRRIFYDLVERPSR
ncbi:hypothetical protein Dimus_006760 [Dionaea muscipula]